LWRIVGCLVEIAEARGATPAQVALAWLLTRPAISSLVVGGRTESQFTENFGAVSMTLARDELTKLDDVSRLPLIYPYWHQHNFALPRFGTADKALHDSYPDRHYGGEDPLI
jgi:diketogulonate reductase-like aldo/keto reductase